MEERRELGLNTPYMAQGEPGAKELGVGYLETLVEPAVRTQWIWGFLAASERPQASCLLRHLYSQEWPRTRLSRLLQDNI